MSERIRVENLYKIFTSAPQSTLALLREGLNKEQVLAQTGQVVGLNNVSLSVPSGAIYMIMGLSGSGKSTLARCINRLNEPSSGKILLDGQDLVTLSERELREVRRTRISMVFQHFALLPNKRVIENVEFGLKLRGMPLAERRRRAEEVLTVVGLARWAHHYPHELSGGMRQRVGLARALATDADVLIMDEAFSALDPLIRSEMQDELLRLQHSLKKTILFITHDFQEALKLGNRIAIMADGEVVREGSPQDIVMRPGNDYVASFTRDVDRSRLFDAHSIMQPLEAQQYIANLNIIPVQDRAIVVDGERRVKGVLSASGLEQLRQGQTLEKVLNSNFNTVSGNTRIIDLSRAYSADQLLIVTDDDGHAIGSVAVEAILHQIADCAPKQQAIGGDNDYI